MEADDVTAELEHVLSTVHGIRVRELVTGFVRKGAPVQKIWLSENDPRAAGNGDLRRNPLRRDWFPGNGRLRILELKVASVLEAELVDHRGSQRGDEPSNDSVTLPQHVPQALLPAKH